MATTDADVAIWTKFEYTLKQFQNGEGAAQTCVVTWRQDGTVDGTATLDRWGPDHAAIPISPQQCQAAQAGLERLADLMREQANAGSFGEPAMSVVYVDAPPPPSPPPAVSVPAAPPAPESLAAEPASRSGRARKRSRSRSRSRSSRSSSASVASSVPRPPRSAAHHASPQRSAVSRSPSHVRPPRSAVSRSPSHTSSASGRASAVPSVKQPTVGPVDSVIPSARSVPGAHAAEPHGGRCTKRQAPRAPPPKRAAMAQQNQQWQKAWVFGEVPGGVP